MDLYVGDIHHQPTIVLLFLGTTILATSYLSFTTGNTLFALLFTVMISALFVGLSRIRANQIGLRLPDILGIEAPIALGMLGLVLVHIAGRASNSVVVLGDSTHLLVFFGGLTMLAGLGLLGRNDLGLRIPNALEGVVYLAALDRVLCVIIGGEVPIPFTLDPFTYDSSALLWTLPFLVIETMLLAAVFLFDWVEGKRIKHELSDHRGAGGRFLFGFYLHCFRLDPQDLRVARSFCTERSLVDPTSSRLVGVADGSSRPIFRHGFGFLNFPPYGSLQLHRLQHFLEQ